VYKLPILRQHVNHGNDICHSQLEKMITKCKNLKKSQPMTPVLIPQRLIVPSAVSQTTTRVPSMNCIHCQFVFLLKNLLMFDVMYKCGQPLFGPDSSPSDADDLLLLLHNLVAQIIT
jgi:hypothetical protein